MRKNIYLQVTEIKNGKYNAGSKARDDCDRILESCGYKLLSLPFPKPTIVSRLIRGFRMFKVMSQLSNADSCFLQYPLVAYGSMRMFCNLAFWLFNGKTTVLIHDIEGLRKSQGIEPDLSYLLRKCDKIIVHTPQMKKILVKSFGLRPENVEVLYLFDYLTVEEPHSVDINGNTVIFAGNLSKSSFISELGKLSENVSFNLYGVYHSNVVESAGCRYMGQFAPDDITAIDGNWGLVWDGDRLDTCHGAMGEYLRINSSHKISLYIAACKPVIVWHESSISRFITEHHLGIAVNSLYEIPERLSSLTPAEKQRIADCVTDFSSHLRRGDMLKRYIDVGRFPN